MILPYLIHLPLLIFLIVFLKKRLQKDPLIPFFYWGISLKMISGILLGLIYVFLYNSIGDTFHFHHYSQLLTEILFKDPQEFFRILFTNRLNSESLRILYFYDEPRAFFFIKILSLLNILTFSNYGINSLYLSLFSFLGIWILANTLIRIYHISVVPVAFAFIILPSFVFWTSGVLKESVVMGAFGILIACILQYIHRLRPFKVLEIIFLTGLFYVCWKIKFYYLLVTFPTLLSYLALTLLSKKNASFQKPYIFLPSFFFLFSILACIPLLIVPGFSLGYLGEIIYHSYRIIQEQSLAAGKYAYQLDGMSADIFQILLQFPKAMIIGLFRPFLWETTSGISMLAGIENTCILVLFLGRLVGFFKTPQKITQEAIALMVYICLNAALMALIAPNWGTLIRYKSAFLPFWVLILCIHNPLVEYLIQYFSKSPLIQKKVS